MPKVLKMETNLSSVDLFPTERIAAIILLRFSFVTASGINWDTAAEKSMPQLCSGTKPLTIHGIEPVNSDRNR